MRKIAFYGKGGIGKSTIAANFSALAAQKGKKVLHIGCDPKMDSTRLLTGRNIPSVLDILRQKNQVEYQDIVYPGSFGISCVESGGPSAGQGCAGLGITITMDQLEETGVLKNPWDYIVYDVLGDVVCGGFSAPMRNGLVDTVYVVTSSDFMALYAANNILTGLKTFQNSGAEFGGLIHNHCSGPEDKAVLSIFSELIKCPVIASVEESRELKNADFCRKSLAEMQAECTASDQLLFLTEQIEKGESFFFEPAGREELEAFRKRIYEKRGDGKWPVQ